MQIRVTLIIEWSLFASAEAVSINTISESSLVITVMYRPLLTTDEITVTLHGLFQTARVSHLTGSLFYRGRRATSYKER